MEKIKIGKIVNAQGIKGEVKVYSYSEDNALFDIVEKVYVDEESFTVMNARYKGKTPILMFGDM